MSDRGEFIIRAENLYGVTEEIVFLNVQPAPREVRPNKENYFQILIKLLLNVMLGEAVPAWAAARAQARAEAVQAVQGGAQQRAHVHLPPAPEGHPAGTDLQAPRLPLGIAAPHGELME